MHRKAGDWIMNQTWKVVIVVVLMISVIAVLTIKRNQSEQDSGAATDIAATVDEPVKPDQFVTEELPKLSDLDSEATAETTAIVNYAAQPVEPVSKVLPKLLDLGSDECIPCKMMAPILEELKTEYAGKFQVEFLDVRKDPALGKAYNIQLIPTQIFFDASGRELFRHEGFYSKEDILAKWKELGIEMTNTE